MATKKRRVKPNTGAKKALAAMIRHYGPTRGRRIFYSRASKFGSKGKTPSQKANSIYGKGSHRVKSVMRRKKS
jgi:hypothetical protein